MRIKREMCPRTNSYSAQCIYLCTSIFIWEQSEKTILAVAPGNTESAINVVKGVMSSLMARSSRCHRLKILTFLRAPLLAGEHQHFPGQV